MRSSVGVRNALCKQSRVNQEISSKYSVETTKPLSNEPHPERNLLDSPPRPRGKIRYPRRRVLSNPLLDTISAIEDYCDYDELVDSGGKKNCHSDGDTYTSYVGSNSIDSGYKSSCPTPEMAELAYYATTVANEHHKRLSLASQGSTSSLPGALAGPGKPRIAMGTRVMTRQPVSGELRRRHDSGFGDAAAGHLAVVRDSLLKMEETSRLSRAPAVRPDSSALVATAECRVHAPEVSVADTKLFNRRQRSSLRFRCRQRRAAAEPTYRARSASIGSTHNTERHQPVSDSTESAGQSSAVRHRSQLHNESSNGAAPPRPSSPFVPASVYSGRHRSQSPKDARECATGPAPGRKLDSKKKRPVPPPVPLKPLITAGKLAPLPHNLARTDALLDNSRRCRQQYSGQMLNSDIGNAASRNFVAARDDTTPNNGGATMAAVVGLSRNTHSVSEPTDFPCLSRKPQPPLITRPSNDDREKAVRKALQLSAVTATGPADRAGMENPTRASSSQLRSKFSHMAHCMMDIIEELHSRGRSSTHEQQPQPSDIEDADYHTYEEVMYSTMTSTGAFRDIVDEAEASPLQPPPLPRRPRCMMARDAPKDRCAPQSITDDRTVMMDEGTVTGFFEMNPQDARVPSMNAPAPNGRTARATAQVSKQRGNLYSLFSSVRDRRCLSDNLQREQVTAAPNDDEYGFLARK